MSSPAANIATLLQTASIGTLGTDLFVGRLPETVNYAISVFDSGGPTPSPKWARDYKDIQIIVRGDVNGYSTAWDKAESIKTYLLGLANQTIGTDVYSNFNMRTDNTFIGYNENNCPQFSLNFRIMIDYKSYGNRLEIV
jgi:hypothetical protein